MKTPKVSTEQYRNLYQNSYFYLINHCLPKYKVYACEIIFLYLKLQPEAQTSKGHSCRHQQLLKKPTHYDANFLLVTSSYNNNNTSFL